MKRKWSELVVNKFCQMGETEMENRLEWLKLLKKPVQHRNALFQVGITLSNLNP